MSATIETCIERVNTLKEELQVHKDSHKQDMDELKNDHRRTEDLVRETREAVFNGLSHRTKRIEWLLWTIGAGFIAKGIVQFLLGGS